MPALSAIVAVAATVPAVGSVIAAKHKEAVVAALLGYSALVGYLVAAASTDALAKRTTGWLGKVGDGKMQRFHHKCGWQEGPCLEHELSNNAYLISLFTIAEC